MATYKSFDELNGETLREDDEVTIAGKKYGVRSRFLFRATSESNEQAMLDANIDSNNFLSNVYGYPADGGDWPECNDGDYEALTRAVLVLMAFYEKSDVEVKMENGTWKMFKREDYTSFDFDNYVIPVFIEIEGFNGFIKPEEFQIGCQTIPFKTVEKVYKIVTSKPTRVQKLQVGSFDGKIKQSTLTLQDSYKVSFEEVTTVYQTMVKMRKRRRNK